MNRRPREVGRPYAAFDHPALIEPRDVDDDAPVEVVAVVEVTVSPLRPLRFRAPGSTRFHYRTIRGE